MRLFRSRGFEGRVGVLSVGGGSGREILLLTAFCLLLGCYCNASGRDFMLLLESVRACL